MRQMMREVIKQALIGLATPMALFGILMSATAFISQDAVWRHEDFWFAFRLSICMAIFVGYVRGFFTYLQLTDGKDNK
jgi:hypothetical protein